MASKGRAEEIERQLQQAKTKDAEKMKEYRPYFAAKRNVETQQRIFETIKLRVLQETNGVLSGNDGAASRLGLKRTTLQSMIKRLDIHPHEYRNGATGTFGKP